MPRALDFSFQMAGRGEIWGGSKAKPNQAPCTENWGEAGCGWELPWHLETRDQEEGSHGVKALRTGREDAQLRGNAVPGDPVQERGDGAKAAGAGNHNRGPDQSQRRQSHKQASGENTREGCGPGCPPMVRHSCQCRWFHCSSLVTGHSAAQLLTHVYFSALMFKAYSAALFRLAGIVELFCLFHISHTKSNLFVCFSTLLDRKHLSTLSPVPSKLPSTEWWAVDVELN